MRLGQTVVCLKNSFTAAPVTACASKRVLIPVCFSLESANVQGSCVLFIPGTGGKPSLSVLFCFSEEDLPGSPLLGL